MSKAHFRFSTDILRRLGEELNPNLAQGLIELVKNAYDADATNCVIEFSSIQQPGGTVTVSDDGNGMNEESLINGWLMLGRSAKNTHNLTSKFNRKPAGNKGLGRLAALRMGRIARVTTRPEKEPHAEYSVKLNWSEFDKADVVEEVPLEIVKRKRPEIVRHGTDIVVEKLRSSVGRMDVRRLARELLLLADPFDDNPQGFSPILKAPEFADMEKLVSQRYFNDAEFHLHAEVDRRGNVKAKVKDWKGKILYSANHDEIRRKLENDPYDCTECTFDLWIYILNQEKFSVRTVTLGEVRAWLKEFGGVHLYTNGIRVAPYGDAGNDWLDMNLSRVKNPELRPATNSSIGRVIVKNSGSSLRQKTDRSGLIEDAFFHDLRLFAKETLDWLARKRLEERENKRSSERASAAKGTTTSRQDISAAIESLPERQREEISTSFERYDKQRERQVRSLQKDVQLYRTMSTVGITVAVFAHESKHPLQIISRDTAQIEKRVVAKLGESAPEVIGRQIQRIVNQTKSLQAFGDLTLNLISKEKRRASRVDLYVAVRGVIKMFELLLADRQVSVNLDFDQGNPYLMGTEAALESIVSNLLTNSLKAFTIAHVTNRQVVIKTQISEGHLTLQFMDNGPGIKDISIREIWLPGETTFENGTGLGLTIVRDSIHDLGGKISANQNGELGGAEFVIELPILGA